MNPYNYILSDFYPNSNFDVESAAIVLLLRVMADGYADTMPAGSNCYAWALQQLSAYAPNAALIKLARDWNTRATR